MMRVGRRERIRIGELFATLGRDAERVSLEMKVGIINILLDKNSKTNSKQIT